MFVKPREGMRVLDPLHKRPLPAEGAEVPDIGFWHRRLSQGDVVECDPPTAPEPAAPAPQAQE